VSAVAGRERAGHARDLRAAIAAAAGALERAGCQTPRLDAEVLLAHVLGISREELLLDGRRALGPDPARAFERALRRRASTREPVAYITGRRAFRALELAVDPRALIPRPETELLVEIGATLPAGTAVLDLGTGSGAIALALKHERPDLAIAASDADGQALELARANARALDLEVRFLCADLLDGVPDEFDAVLANLPYVAERERAALAPEITRHEPPRALFAGEDGLDAIRALVAQAGARRRIAMLALELGAGQADAVAGLLCEHGFAQVSRHRDLACIERVAVGRRTRA
jgi:release factor glutamine methyltransferase